MITWETSLLTRINEPWAVVKGVVCCMVRRVNPSICFSLFKEKELHDWINDFSSHLTPPHTCVRWKAKISWVITPAKCNKYKIQLTGRRNVSWTQWRYWRNTNKSNRIKKKEDLWCLLLLSSMAWKICTIKVFDILHTALKLSLDKNLLQLSQRQQVHEDFFLYLVVCVWNVHGSDSQVMDKGSVITPCSWQVSHPVKGR